MGVVAKKLCTRLACSKIVTISTPIPQILDMPLNFIYKNYNHILEKNCKPLGLAMATVIVNHMPRDWTI